ncbi:hypothetical protein MG293_019816 [Ovis ammon polii]|uniref:Uncharacterized protein n=1 Tax=Ovis ammon polii TaxID=230172 RepID=A0AAD4XXR9_OVIAM|nr:hypothetical protein MG293_019816 [Ovis ammon polii]
MDGKSSRLDVQANLLALPPCIFSLDSHPGHTSGASGNAVRILGIDTSEIKVVLCTGNNWLSCAAFPDDTESLPQDRASIVSPPPHRYGPVVLSPERDYNCPYSLHLPRFFQVIESEPSFGSQSKEIQAKDPGPKVMKDGVILTPVPSICSRDCEKSLLLLRPGDAVTPDKQGFYRISLCALGPTPGNGARGWDVNKE